MCPSRDNRLTLPLRCVPRGPPGTPTPTPASHNGVMPQRPREVLTLLLTDVESSTAWVGQDPDGAYAAIRRHEEIAQQIVAKHGGTLHKKRGEGDSLFCTFPVPMNAVEAAAELQRALQEEPWPGRPLQMRAALHTGEVDRTEDDFFGMTINRAARIRGVLHGGMTVASRATVELIAHRAPAGTHWHDLGEHRLKDLLQPIPLFALIDPRHTRDLPPLASLNVYPQNLPIQLTRFVGRRDALRRVRDGLDASRLVTLTGTGGGGKTRLGLQAAAELHERFPDGTWFIDLATNPPEVAVEDAILQTLRVRRDAQPAGDQLAAHLADWEGLLLLDNCEHLIDTVAAAVSPLLRAAPRLRILATSREPLRVTGERVLRVPSLSLPEGEPATLETARPSEAVTLFVQSAQSADDGFALSEANVADVARLVRLLDGIPLAIEQAAAQVTVATPHQIHDELERRVLELEHHARDVDPRHRTMRGVIAWSEATLTEAERRVFLALAVFAGSFDLEAAQALSEGVAVRPAIARLVDKSLLLSESHGDEMRFRLLEPVRQYAEEQRPVPPELRDRHLDHFLALAERAYTAETTPDVGRWTRRLELDTPNLRAAMAWAEAHAPAKRFRLAFLLRRFWYRTGALEEGSDRLAGAIEAWPAADISEVCRMRIVIGALRDRQTRFDDAIREYRAAQELADLLGDPVLQVAIRNNLGTVYLDQETYAAAAEAFRGAAELGDRTGQKDLAAQARLNLGTALGEAGSHAEATEQLTAALQVFEASGNVGLAAGACANLAHLAMRAGDRERSLTYLRSALDRWRNAVDVTPVGHALVIAAEAVGEAAPLEALRLLGAAEAVWQASGSRPPLRQRRQRDTLIETLTPHLDPREARRALTAGRALTVDAAVRLARTALG